MNQGVTKRCRLSWLTTSGLVYEPKCGGGLRGLSLSQWVQHMEPNKLWRSNSTFNLCCKPVPYVSLIQSATIPRIDKQFIERHCRSSVVDGLIEGLLSDCRCRIQVCIRICHVERNYWRCRSISSSISLITVYYNGEKNEVQHIFRQHLQAARFSLVSQLLMLVAQCILLIVVWWQSVAI